MRCAVLFGSQSGNSALVAEAAAARLGRGGLTASVLDGASASLQDLAPLDLLLVCTSSHGNGELPDNLVAFHEALVAAGPDLSHLDYVVFAIGDMTYAETFCFAGATMDRTLAGLGAKRLAPVVEVDVSEQVFAETPVLDWIDAWLASRESRG